MLRCVVVGNRDKRREPQHAPDLCDFGCQDASGRTGGRHHPFEKSTNSHVALIAANLALSQRRTSEAIQIGWHDGQYLARAVGVRVKRDGGKLRPAARSGPARRTWSRLIP